MNRGPEYWVCLAMDFSPLIPIAVAWVQIARSDGRSTRTNLLSLMAATASLLWINVGLFLPDAIGSTNESLRSLIINANFIVMTIAAGMAVGKMRYGRIATAIGCFMAAFAWSYLGLLNILS